MMGEKGPNRLLFHRFLLVFQKKGGNSFLSTQIFSRIFTIFAIFRLIFCCFGWLFPFMLMLVFWQRAGPRMLDEVSASGLVTARPARRAPQGNVDFCSEGGTQSLKKIQCFVSSFSFACRFVFGRLAESWDEWKRCCGGWDGMDKKGPSREERWKETGKADEWLNDWSVQGGGQEWFWTIPKLFKRLW